MSLFCFGSMKEIVQKEILKILFRSFEAVFDNVMELISHKVP